jgi:two-component system alkaline phosphatase synthesis response regulator PhoP
MTYGYSVQDSIKVVLEAENYCVVKAPGSFSALEAIKTEKPDLVLLDTGLAEVDGLRYAGS